jgi:hypothetical protein
MRLKDLQQGQHLLGRHYIPPIADLVPFAPTLYLMESAYTSDLLGSAHNVLVGHLEHDSNAPIRLAVAGLHAEVSFAFE